MAQTEALIEILKQTLKSRHMTYAEVGRRLKMSEANVKRMFASKRFSLDRVEDICRVMDMELTDLLYLYEESRQRITQLTLKQEQELVKDLKLLLVAVSVRNRLTFEDILSNYQLSDSECIQCLARLDKLKIIDLLPQNRIKLRIDDDFRWLPNGPIEKFFEKHLQSQFLKSRFSGELANRRFLFGLLSDSSAQQLLTKLQTLAKEFTDLHRQDSRLPLEKRHTIGLMLAMRPWEAAVFKPFLRQPEK
ncbi:MAG: hypothetical protein AMJ53_05290 [Gammaproteobacteria bacterium SG8_11]|nr:MAG: hypothetical protein AMJ53_05290 [Gammaproteobacteria bacterium SG8_11]